MWVRITSKCKGGGIYRAARMTRLEIFIEKMCRGIRRAWKNFPSLTVHGTVIALWLFAALAFAGCFGCRGYSEGTYRGDSRDIKFSPDGTLTVTEKHGRASGSQVAPKDAKESSPLNVGVDGVTSETSGTWEAKAINYASKYAPLIFYSLSALCLIAGALSLWKGKWMLGACLLGACAIAAAVPSLIGFLAWLIGGIVVLILIGGVWFVAQFIRDHNRLKDVAPGVAKLVKEGQSTAAIAAIRAAEPRLDKAFTKVAKL